MLDSAMDSDIQERADHSWRYIRVRLFILVLGDSGHFLRQKTAEAVLSTRNSA